MEGINKQDAAYTMSIKTCIFP